MVLSVDSGSSHIRMRGCVRSSGATLSAHVCIYLYARTLNVFSIVYSHADKYIIVTIIVAVDEDEIVIYVGEEEHTGHE